MTRPRRDDADLYASLFGDDGNLEDLRPPAIGVSGRPMMRVTSRYARKVVEVDLFAPNALLLEAEQAVPEVYELAMAEAAPPTLFNTGDLPPFTASGLDPQVLNGLPWTARHYAASSESKAEVLQMVEDYAEFGDGASILANHEHNGRTAYENRMKTWLIGPPADEPTLDLSSSFDTDQEI